MKGIYLFAVLTLMPLTANAGDAMDICLITGQPAAGVEYEKIQNLKIGKGSYGSVTDVLPAFANKANALGANAVVNYIGSQRFGFWPWRFIRPVVRGEAVKLNLAADQTCKDAGGATVRQVISTNMEPHLL
tara:strand:+ start:530 stop:922 length:393 start_codon:yes stop_codon:yes gene_type:complete